jgi:hypothetical protein
LRQNAREKSRRQEWEQAAGDSVETERYKNSSAQDWEQTTGDSIETERKRKKKNTRVGVKRRIQC